MNSLKHLQVTIDYIYENLESEIALDELAILSGYSVDHYQVLFKKYVGIPVGRFIVKTRLEHVVFDVSNGKMTIDAALNYGFDTYAGFYKAFKKVYGCSPKKYLAMNEVHRPHKRNLEEDFMIQVTKNEVKQLIKKWGVDPLKIEQCKGVGGEEVSHHTWFVNDNLVFKITRDIELLNTHLKMSKALKEKGYEAQSPLEMPSGDEIFEKNGLYHVLMNKVQGSIVHLKERRNKEFLQVCFEYGKALASLHKTLLEIDLEDVKDNSFHDTVSEWALPETLRIMEQWGHSLDKEKIKRLKTSIVGSKDLKKQIIHRDPNPSNILVENNKVTGFIDFEISERNIRLFDVCYLLTGLLSEDFSELKNNNLWFDYLIHILKGYESIDPLTLDEKEMMLPTILGIQSIFVAWTEGKDDLIELAKKSREMFQWLLEKEDKLQLLI